MFSGELELILLMIPVMLISLTVHEFSHGYIAYRLGDTTAKDQGRLTLNPLKHLDPVGTIMMIIARVGWAKPVPVNPYFFKDRKKGMMLVSVAGPLSNILMAFTGVFLFQAIANSFYASIIGGNKPLMYILDFLRLFFAVNLNLAIFNLLPVPPLDGSKILSGVLPSEMYFRFMQHERTIGMVFLFIVIAFPGVLGSILGFFTNPIAESMIWISNKLIGLFV
ncbi:MAG: site-2 protease family protein [Clostridiaceae bacterium]|jgi:Zn-dependent protease|nr:site-2 protease family protein [Clostridiaceae bacterium]